jgi:hypothetical protein
MLWAFFFSDYRFDDEAKATALLEYLEEAGGPFAPARYGEHEPARQPYTPEARAEAARLLAGHPRHLGGDLALRGARNLFRAAFRWYVHGPLIWDFEVDDSFFTDAARAEEFADFVGGLCRRFPVLFGGAAPEGDWMAKNWIVEYHPDGSLRRTKQVGLNIEGCLPGVYWLTVFGPALVEHFGRRNLERLPTHRVIDLGDAGLLLMLRALPSAPEPPTRLRHDQKIVGALGAEYFFDIGRREKKCRPIKGVTGRAEAGETQGEEPADAAPEASGAGSAPDGGAGADEDGFEQQVIVSPDGVPYRHPREMAEATVVYFHADIEGLNDYSEDSLRALDEYFAAHPQTAEYTREHLVNELTPALGAYFGEVLVKQLGGKWVRRKPLLKSVVKVRGREMHPFRAAYRAVFAGERLADVYDSAARPR